MTTQIQQNITEILKTALRHKFANYNPEPAVMPFHTRLLGKDRLALFSFIHSLNTNFGTSIFEPVAMELGKKRFKRAEKQFTVGEQISSEAQRVIQNIMDSLISATEKPNKHAEIEAIRFVCQKGVMHKIKPTKVDVFFESTDGELFLFDIKTAKPNVGGFKEFKRTLLEWSAVCLAQNPATKINTLIAIPYNPYDPKPYSRWTMAGMLDLDAELKVAEEFWNFLGSENTYSELLHIFETVGLELRSEIDAYFSKHIK